MCLSCPCLPEQLSSCQALSLSHKLTTEAPVSLIINIPVSEGLMPGLRSLSDPQALMSSDTNLPLWQD